MLAVEVADDPSSDSGIDLYVFDCTDTQCRSAGSVLGFAAPRLRRINPKPGLWKIVVDAASIRAGTRPFVYTDVIADPALGVVAAADGRRLRRTGATWAVSANVWLAKQPAAGRVPQALLVVTALAGANTIPIALGRVPIEITPAANIH